MHKMNPNGNVLIFTPTLGLPADPATYQSSLLKVINQIQARQMGLAYFPTYRQLWHKANNMAWDLAFEQKFEYILRIDDDIHDITDDAFGKLLDADKDVIGAAYPNRRWPYFTAAMNRTNEKSLIEIWLTSDKSLQYVSPTSEDPEGIVPCELVGFGMTLIKTEPFKYLQRPLYLGYEDCPDDTFLAQICLDNGIKQFVHFGVKLAHAHVNYYNNNALYTAGIMEQVNKKEVVFELNEEEQKIVDAQKSQHYDGLIMDITGVQNATDGNT